VKARDDERLQQALDGLFGEGEPAAADEQARLASELARVREALRGRAFARPRDEARFVDAVLARTTREDLSWRGDLRLLRAFLGERLRASPALRLVAASLALHLVAAPALAWWMLHERPAERAFTLHVELPSELPFVDELPPLEQPTDELRAEAHAREARENERAFLRRSLLEGGAVLPSPAASPQGAMRLLARHLAALRTRQAPALESLPAEAGLLEQALALELALDRRWLGAQDEDVGRVGAAVLARALLDDPRAAAADFAACTLRRAWSEGLFEGPPPAAARPFTPAWFEALTRAVHDDPSAEAVLRWCLAAQAK